jgi:pilus assembly protein FimV
LLEIYFARKDSPKFGAVAAELRVLTHGLGTEWTQAAQLGQQLDPGNLLYGGSSSSNGKLAPSVSHPAPSTVLAGASDIVMPASSVSPAKTSSASLAFQPESTQATTLAQTLSWATPAVLTTPSSLAPNTQQPTIKPPIGRVGPDEGASSVSVVEDFGIKLEGLLDERRKDGGDGLSLAPLDIPRAAKPSPTNDVQLADLAPLASAKTDVVALKTKIDLAMACQEIGDKEAARHLLTEVASTGHAELASRAQSLLRQLA